MYVVLKTKQGKRGCPLYTIRYNIQSHLKQPKQPKSPEYTGVKGRASTVSSLCLPPIEGARHRPQGVAVHLLETFPVYKMPFLSSLQIF